MWYTYPCRRDDTYTSFVVCIVFKALILPDKGFFLTLHGSCRQGKGLNIANPLAQILSVAMLYEYFNLKEEGKLIREAVNASARPECPHTGDSGRRW